MNLIEVGQIAQDFSLQDTNGEIIKLSDFRGKRVLLSWHPLAWTSVCTDQMRSLEVNFEKFKELNTVPLGMSIDSVPCKRAWATAICIKNVSLLSDFWPHGKVADEFGIFLEEKGISQRVNIIIDEKGVVRWVKVYPIKQLPDINEVLEVLSTL